eukprot:533266_1
MLHVAFVFVSILLSNVVYCIDNGLGIKPHMGWRSWNAYHENINQKAVMETLAAMLNRSRLVNGKPTSLLDIGYSSAGVDEGWVTCINNSYWHNASAPNGWPMVNPSKFPNITNMTSYAHKNKLKIGWYMNCCGCAEKNPYPANEHNDVAWLRMYDIDSIKLDGCGSSHNISNWQRLINESSNKPLLTENCHDQPDYANLSWCPMNFFRSSTDINKDYVHDISNNLHSVIPYTKQYPTGFISRPGCFAYPDMLEVGHFKSQYNAKAHDMDQTHFSAWCIVSSPLVLGFRLSNDTLMDEVWDIITNLETINVSQTWGGHPGRQIVASNYTLVYDQVKSYVDHYGNPSLTYYELAMYEIWTKPLLENKWAVLLMNNDGNYSHDITVQFVDIPWNKPTANIRDIINHKDLGSFSNNYTAKNIPPFGSAFLVLSE